MNKYDRRRRDRDRRQAQEKLIGLVSAVGFPAHGVPGTERETVALLWAEFAQAVGVPPDGVQRQEMRRSFYAGAWALIQAMKNVGADDVSEDAGAAYLAALERELIQFKTDVAGGRA